MVKVENRSYFIAALFLFRGNGEPEQRHTLHGHCVLTGHVGVEHFAFDDKPELLPVPLAFLTPAEIATDGGALSGGGHLGQG